MLRKTNSIAHARTAWMSKCVPLIGTLACAKQVSAISHTVISVQTTIFEDNIPLPFSAQTLYLQAT